MNRIFVEKKTEFNAEAKHLFQDIKSSLAMDGLRALRVTQRYDVDGLSDQEFSAASRLILSEPQVDSVSTEPAVADDETAFAVEYLPGQFDQRADSAAQCVQILTEKQRPLIAAAKVIILRGSISDNDLARIKDFVINAVDSREASMDLPDSLTPTITIPDEVAVLEGFTSSTPDDLLALREELGLAMSHQDLLFCQTYFRDEEQRDPTITEIRMLDTYWSDHCRHTTFLTRIEAVRFDPGTGPVETAYAKYQAVRDSLYGSDTDRPVTLMDIALMGMKELRDSGELDNLEVSDEINAASIIVPVDVDGEEQEWLVMFKNETHNHPTEIEPFGGAATCLGGAIRDPLSGRAYVYQAMRVTGAGDPRQPFTETLPGKLPQRKICQIAAQGYSSYGNQIGLATGKVSEVYHHGYVAKRMEIGAVIAAAPRANVFRGKPATDDVILLIGGRTGRDGVGGATGSSKEHTDTALDNSAEVQKGDPPTERKIQRLFRNPELAKRIKVCNDFGAGGVSVAIGEIAPSLDINLDRILKKYEGLDGTELAISESQERMAVLVDRRDVKFFIRQADLENLECVPVAEVADHGRLVIKWRGTPIVNLSRAFLDTNGVQQSSRIHVTGPAPSDSPLGRPIPAVADAPDLATKFTALLSDLNHCSQKGLGEMFDSSIGAGTVLSPFGGCHQLTPNDAMAAKIPLLEGETNTCTFMAWGFNPRIAQWSPFHGAVYAVTESVCRVVAAGGRLPDIRLTLQEYFEKLGTDPTRWGKPFAALLGAFHAQHALRLAAIGGKDSMSGSFNDLDVPPTLVSFAVAPGRADRALSPEFKKAGSRVHLVEIARDNDGLPDLRQLRVVAGALHTLNQDGHILALHSLGEGGIAAGLATMAFGNGIGFRESAGGANFCLFRERYAAFLMESASDAPIESALPDAVALGTTVQAPCMSFAETELALSDLHQAWATPLESIYPTQAISPHPKVEAFNYEPSVPAIGGLSLAEPRVIIPVFPGTNCEYDTARAFRSAGAEPRIIVFRNLTARAVDESLHALANQIRQSQILMLPGGFSAGDEPDGSGKFIATVLRNPIVSDAVMDLLTKRDGLILGICNGFQALIKTGLVPFGEIRDPEPDAPTLTFNDIGRHVSTYVTTRVASTLSPWLTRAGIGSLHRIPISHGEGKFYASEACIGALAAQGQIATQYCDAVGVPSQAIACNPNGSLHAVEGISSPDGRVLGKMGHSERRGTNVARNIPGDHHQPLFKAGVEYFTG
jgi:phosphoribosylformylglycinamidine synthase